MSTPTTPYPHDSLTDFPDETPAPRASDPDNPPWGVMAAVVMWMASIFALGVIPFFAITSYLSYRHIPLTQESMEKALTVDPQGILASIASVIPAHLLTVALVWALVTGFGRRPFFQTLGWRFTERFGFWTSAGLAAGLLVLGGVIINYAGGSETDIDQIITSSSAARFTTAFLAVATAPMVEELIYRGLLYPALRRAIGMIAAILCVSTLFALVHAWQYRNNLGVIATITILSFTLTTVRARTGRLLPSFVIHTVFNGIQSAFLVYQYFHPEPEGEIKAGLIVQLLTPLAHALGLPR